MEDEYKRIFALTATTPDAKAALFYRRSDHHAFPTSLHSSRATSVATTHDGEAEAEEMEVRRRLRPRADLEFKFDQVPKDTNAGFVFGKNEHSCDVRLYLQGGYISPRHFKIYPDDQGRLILESYPDALPISVSYNGQGGDQVRSASYNPDPKQKPTGFKWIIRDSWTKNMNIEIHVTHRRRVDVSFKVELGQNWSPYFAQYVSNLGKYSHLPPMHGLTVESAKSSRGPSEISTPSTAPIYYPLDKLGQGKFAVVYKVVNISTGDQVAMKVYDREIDFKDIKKECDILRDLSHVSHYS